MGVRLSEGAVRAITANKSKGMAALLAVFERIGENGPGYSDWVVVARGEKRVHEIHGLSTLSFGRRIGERNKFLYAEGIKTGLRTGGRGSCVCGHGEGSS